MKERCEAHESHLAAEKGIDIIEEECKSRRMHERAGYHREMQCVGGGCRLIRLIAGGEY